MVIAKIAFRKPIHEANIRGMHISLSGQVSLIQILENAGLTKGAMNHSLLMYFSPFPLSMITCPKRFLKSFQSIVICLVYFRLSLTPFLSKENAPKHILDKMMTVGDVMDIIWSFNQIILVKESLIYGGLI